MICFVWIVSLLGMGGGVVRSCMQQNEIACNGYLFAMHTFLVLKCGLKCVFVAIGDNENATTRNFNANRFLMHQEVSTHVCA